MFGGPGYYTRTGSYEIQEAEGVQDGTKIVLHLKTEHRQFSDEDTVLSMSHFKTTNATLIVQTFTLFKML